ncbi:hypothetical protein VP1G_06938 [Cytospora mali]|uniref:Clr5 domain-containing protein n=1 Tax=Cytospora mali TaxID=578113 RepID=A0A194V706_CYTMA|nr:hypothetical protein VP1G_06938 [Valsa mali var. pyri (nom. inval.)]
MKMDHPTGGATANPVPSRASSQATGAWATPDDWIKMRPIITKHYRDDNMKLKELILFMDKTYGFRATAKMYKDRLTKWRISKNVKASDITTIIKKEDALGDTTGPEFYVVGDRLIRADRLQQAMQRRATVARRCRKSGTKKGESESPSPSWESLPSGPLSTWEALRGSTPLSPQMSMPDTLRVPECVLLHSRGYILGTFESIKVDGVVVDLKHEGPVHRCRMAFEETLANLGLVQGLDRVAFKSLDGAFDLIRPCLLDRDPQFIVVFLQIMSLCLWFKKPEIMQMLVAYLHDLSRLVLGSNHPITLICRELKTADVEASRHICKLAAEAAWHQFRGYLYPFKIDSFVRLTGTYADILDSLDLNDERESFLRYVVNSCDIELVPVEQRLHLELHLIMCLRRQNKFPEALERLDRIRQDIMDNEPTLMRESEERCVELTYQALRINGMCECDGGDVEKGRDFFRQAFQLMQEKKGRYSPRTTRALRDVVRYSEPDEELLKDLEDRLGKFSLETENFL